MKNKNSYKNSNTLPIAFQKNLNLNKARLLAPLSKRYKKIASLQALAPELVFIAGNCISFNDGKALFVKNHKAGCSTVTHLIYDQLEDADYEGNIHHEYSKLVQGLPHFPTIVKALKDPDCYKFTFVRDPVSRAVSAYKNIFLEQTNEAWSLHEKDIRKWGFKDTASPEDNFDVYLEYITESLGREPYLTDPHFRCQVDNVGIQHIHYNYIGRVETMLKDLKEIPHLLSKSTEMGSAPKKEIITNRSTIRFTPNEKQVSLIKEIYRRDYKAFFHD